MNPYVGLAVQLAAITGQEREGFIELRAFMPDRVIQRFYPVQRFNPRAEDSPIMRDALALAVHGNVNLGAAPRSRQSGKRTAVERVWMLWADIDTPDALERLRPFKPRPHLEVCSGTEGHRHVYWMLRDPLTAEEAEQANRRLAARLLADRQATDAARMLRAVGTLNHKTDPPKPVELVDMDCRSTYQLAAVLEDVPPLPVEPPPVFHRARLRLVNSPGGDVLLTIPSVEWITALTGRPVDEEGRVQCPFHKGGAERTPSMVVYEDPERGFVCFGGCDPSPGRQHFGGDVYSFAARWYGLDAHRDFPEIRRRLAADLLGATEVAA